MHWQTYNKLSIDFIDFISFDLELHVISYVLHNEKKNFSTKRPPLFEMQTFRSEGFQTQYCINRKCYLIDLDGVFGSFQSAFDVQSKQKKSVTLKMDGDGPIENETQNTFQQT